MRKARARAAGGRAAEAEGEERVGERAGADQRQDDDEERGGDGERQHQAAARRRARRRAARRSCAGRRPRARGRGRRSPPTIRITLAKEPASVRSMAPRRLVSRTAWQRRQRSRPPWGTGATVCSMSQVGQARRSGEAVTAHGRWYRRCAQPGDRPRRRSERRRRSSRTARSDDRDRDEDGGDGEDRRGDLLAEADEHLPGQGLLRGGADEEHHHHLVEGGDEGEERAGDHPGQDQRHLHLEEGADGAGAEVGGGAGEALVEADQRGGDGDDDEGDAERGVGEDDAPVGALQPEAGVEEVHAGGGDDQRHDHRRDQDRHDGAAERHVRLAEADGGERCRARPRAASRRERCAREFQSAFCQSALVKKSW